MKKKTLAVLLVIPFIISLLTFVSIKILDNAVAVDILGIEWNYGENEGFRIDEDKTYALEATPIVDPDMILANGNDLIWKTKKINTSDDEYARVEEKDGKYYLRALKEGEVEVICQNERGSVSRNFNAVIYKDGAMIINPKRKTSGNKIDKTNYYGLYDLEYQYGSKDSYTKKKSSFEIESSSFREDGVSHENEAVKMSDNITYKDDVITFLDKGSSYLTLKDPVSSYEATYYFEVVDGVNIYSYDDLLQATNDSSRKENIVLQKNLESLKNTYRKDDKGNYIETLRNENTSLFGHYDFAKQEYSFSDEVYRFTTTYDSTYIDNYNATASEDKKLSKEVISGIHLKGNLYGNGYSINMDGLCYPYHGKIDSISGKLKPGDKDLFQGPLPFVSIGDPSQVPLITALGQDNSGIYVSDDGITINDVRLSNVNEVDNTYNLSYTGTVLDIKAKNVTVKNSILSNGKVVLRAYDADNLLVDNCILKNSGEFTMLVGSDKANGYDKDRNVDETFHTADGDVHVSKGFQEFFDDNDSSPSADTILNDFLSASVSDTDVDYDYVSSMTGIQKYLDNTTGILDSNGNVIDYACRMKVNNTKFARSGVFSIATESIFNGPLLYGGIPSMITSLLEMLNAPLPKGLGKTSYPVYLELTGNSEFYDWKSIDSIDVSSLIEENISYMLQQLGMGDKSLTIDDIFPMKKALREVASKEGLIYRKDGVDYINTEIANYGGGLNLSKVEEKVEDTSNTYSDSLEVSLIEELSKLKMSQMRALMVDCVVVTIGSHPFRFIVNGKEESKNPILFDKVPGIDDLKENIRQ